MGATAPQERQAPEQFRLVVLASKDEVKGADEAWPIIVFDDALSYVPQAGDYVYAPVREPLSLNHLHNVAISLAAAAIDFVIVSHGLDDAPMLTIGERRDALIVRQELAEVVRNGQPLPTGSCGRLVRLVPASANAVLNKRDVSDVIGFPCAIEGPYIFVGSISKSAQSRSVRAIDTCRASALDLDKPTVLVLPAMFAVGGVERNTVDVIRALQDRYRFVVATNEPHHNERGSLHWQLDGITAGVFDLAEVALPNSHLEILNSLDQIYGFELVWLCNGSCWLAANAAELRSTFSRVPIVDQQVYDTKEGWIAHFDNQAMKSADRFIAVNRPILSSFSERYGIPPAKIDLIYPAIEEERFCKSVRCRATGEFRQSIDVPADAFLFAMIGRLTKQKRPMDFLDLAMRAKASGLPDVFLIVGNGELAKQCRTFGKAQQLDNLRFVDYCEDPGRLYPEISGLIIMSEYEGLPIVAIEAMAMGTPVLATDVGDLRKVFEDHSVGHLFSSIGNPERQFGEFISWRQSLFEHSKRSLAAADSVRDRFSSKAIADQYDTCFKNAAAQRKTTNAVCGIEKALFSLSIVVPTFNRASMLAANLRRCAELASGIDVEFIVIDDGSTDETAEELAELAAEMPQLIWRSVPNCGPGKARNIGASIASKDVILFIGDDIEPLGTEFFRVHSRLHARNPQTSFAVLGKVVWPRNIGINFVMAHIQGPGGEQFGYSDMMPFTFYDYRFFYTCNISVKRAIVEDWQKEGFSEEFNLAAFEDTEFAYRMNKRAGGLKIYYDPTSVGAHYHRYTVGSFLSRQTAAGMMAAVFVRQHPEVADAIRAAELQRALQQPVALEHELMVANYLSVIEGVKSYARLIEMKNAGKEYWHDHLLEAVFSAAYDQGFLSAVSDCNANLAAAYEVVLDRMVRRLRTAIHREITGDNVAPEPASSQVSAPGPAPNHIGAMRRLRNWASGKPKIVQAYRQLRRLAHKLQ